MIQVGVGEKTVAALNAAIVAILKSDADESTKVAALETLKHGTTVSGTTITGSQFTRS